MTAAARHIPPVALAMLTACASAQPAADVPFSPEYLGIQTALLDGDLVDFTVKMKGARSAADVDDYAKCAAARYALIRGYGFARHVRTTVEQSAGLWKGDAVYTISDALPQGLKTIDAEVTVSSCEENGIPTI